MLNQTIEYILTLPEQSIEAEPPTDPVEVTPPVVTPQQVHYSSLEELDNDEEEGYQSPTANAVGESRGSREDEESKSAEKALPKETTTAPDKVPAINLSSEEEERRSRELID